MALEIVNHNEAFEVKGSLNKSNVKKFQSHFKSILKRNNRIVINIDELENVDSEGVSAFEDLYKQSRQLQKKLYITGFGCRDMYEHLRTLKLL
ncbi:STAS domain-containing protein [Mangrovimonas aestuarii]|uniref:STAS domain-containing protein n=1 Tax=Mangrovimonas aestuarii TaxID=3018443 RepID=UPI002379E906|nr:STAS domain-containing protein [Mangrovimonas aestuarii]